MNLEENMASEINQPQKYKYYVINAYEIKAKLQKAHRTAIAKGWELFNGYGVSFLPIKTF